MNKGMVTLQFGGRGLPDTAKRDGVLLLGFLVCIHHVLKKLIFYIEIPLVY